MQPITRHSSLLLFFSIILIGITGHAQVPDDSFSIVILPDTQIYSAKFPQTFTAQTQWVVQNKDTLNIQFVIGVGDIVDDPTSTTQWINANTSADHLNGIVPYAFDIGNHDYDNFKPSARQTTQYNTYFGIPRYSGFAWYLGSSNGTTNENFQTTFTVNGRKYIVLALEWYPRSTVVSWAQSVIANNPDAKFFIVSHAFVFWDGTRVDRCDSNEKPSDGNWPQDIWKNVLSQHSNVVGIFSGHFVSTNSAHRTDPGVNGNLVHQIFTNFQNWSGGGQGYLRILNFHPSQNRIDVSTISVTGNPELTTPAYKFSVPITSTVAPGTPGSIAGKVRTTGCTAIAGATVTANGVSAITDASGHFTIDGLPAGSYAPAVTASGFAASSATTAVAAGYATQQDFYLSASNTGGNTPPCTLNPTKPSVTICTPTNGASVNSPLHVVAGSNSNSTISYMQAYIDGVKQYQVNAGTLDASIPVAPGTRRLTVQAKDTSGVVFKQSISITVGNTTGSCTAGALPSVTICSPSNNATVASPVRIVARADSAQVINYMQVYVDSVKLATISARSIDQSFTIAKGARRVTVQAKQADGTVIKNTITVNVQ